MILSRWGRIMPWIRVCFLKESRDTEMQSSPERKTPFPGFGKRRFARLKYVIVSTPAS